MGGCQSKWKSVQIKMREWRTKLKSKFVDLLHCDDVSEVIEEDKSVSSSGYSLGIVLIVAELAVFFQFPPDPLTDSLKWTLTSYAHGGAGAFTVICGLAHMLYNTLYAGPSPKATKIKKWISCMGIFSLAISLFLRPFLTMPAKYIATVTGIALALVCIAFGFGVRYGCSGVSETTQANSNGQGIPLYVTT